MQKIKIKTMASNLLSNWYFPIGAAAFYCANVQWYFAGRFVPEGLGLAFIFCMLFAAVTPPIIKRVQAMGWQLKVLAAATAIGMFWDPSVIPLGGISFGAEAEYLNSLFQTQNLPVIAGELLTAGAWFFAFVCVAMLFEKMQTIILDTGLLRNIPLWEWAVYGVILMISATVILVAFSESRAFYGQGGVGAVIYSSDSYLIVPQSAYLNFFHDENDIRQPLFAVFVAPLTGIAYFLGAWLYRWPTAQMLLLDYTQLLLVFCGSFFLANALKLKPLERVCFMLLFCCSYMYMLFILMMEQYAVAFFWLALCIYLICCNKPDTLFVLGAGGTLITSLALVPLAQNENPRRNFWGWFWGCAKQGLAYVFVMIASCRLDAILDLQRKSKILGEFTGKRITFGDKVFQFFAFIRNCFLAPDTYIDFVGEGGPAWWQQPVTEVNAAGVILIVLLVISLWLNRKKRSSFVFGYWFLFSAVVLAGIGWGTNENGLMLYGLYFGWAYFALLFQLVQWVAEKWKKAWLVPAATAVAAAAMLAVNIPETWEMIRFAITYYPG